MATHGRGVIFAVVYIYFVLYLLSMRFYANASKSDRRKCQAYPINATDTKEDVLQKRVDYRSLSRLDPRSREKRSIIRTQPRIFFPSFNRRHTGLAIPLRSKRLYRPYNVGPNGPYIIRTVGTPLSWGTTTQSSWQFVQEFQPFVPKPSLPPSKQIEPEIRHHAQTGLTEKKVENVPEIIPSMTGALTDPCLSVPCIHEGTCTRDLSKGPHGYICTCLSRFQGHHCEEEIKEYAVTAEGLLEIEDLIGGAFGIGTLICLCVIVHCIRVSRRRSELKKEYKEKLVSGDILPLPPPDWCDVSNALCQGFFCYCCRNCGDTSDSEQAVPLLEEYQSGAQGKDDELKRLLNKKSEDVLRKVSGRNLVPGPTPSNRTFVSTQVASIRNSALGLVPLGSPGRRLSSSVQVRPALSQVYESYPGTSQAEKSPEEDGNSRASEDEDDDEEEEDNEEDDEEDEEEEEETGSEEMESHVEAENKMAGGEIQAVVPTGNGHHLMMTQKGETVDNYNQRQMSGGMYGPERVSLQYIDQTNIRNRNNQAICGSCISEYPYDRRMSAYYQYPQQRQSSMCHYNINCNHFCDQREQCQQKEHESHPAEQSQQNNNFPFPGTQIQQDNVNAAYSHHLEYDHHHQQRQQHSSENTYLDQLDATSCVNLQGPAPFKDEYKREQNENNPSLERKQNRPVYPFYRPWTRAEHKLLTLNNFHIPSPSPTTVTISRPRERHSSDKYKATNSSSPPNSNSSRSFGKQHKSGNTITAASPTSDIEQNVQNFPEQADTKLPQALTHNAVSLARTCINRACDGNHGDSALENLSSVENFAKQNCSSFRNLRIDEGPPSSVTHCNYVDRLPSTSSHYPDLPDPSRNFIAQDEDQDSVPSTSSSIPLLFAPADNSSPLDSHLHRFAPRSKDSSVTSISNIKSAAQDSHKSGKPSAFQNTPFMLVPLSQSMNDESRKENKTILEDNPKSISDGEVETKGLILMRRFRFDVTNANTKSEGSHGYHRTNLPSDYCNNSGGCTRFDFGDSLGRLKIKDWTHSKDIMDILDYDNTKADSKPDETILNTGQKDEDEEFVNIDDLDIDFNLISFDDDISDHYTGQCSSNLLKASADFSGRYRMRPSNDTEEGQSITTDLNESISTLINESFGLETDTSTTVRDENHLLGRSGETQIHIIDFSDLTKSLQ